MITDLAQRHSGTENALPSRIPGSVVRCATHSGFVIDRNRHWPLMGSFLVMSLASACMLPSASEQRTDGPVEVLVPTEAAADSAHAVDDAVAVEEEDDRHHTDALETYRYWAGHDPEEGMQVLHGEYWASSHWSKEYTLYMELRFDGAEDFVFANKFQRSKEWVNVPAGSPEWFAPRKHYQVWTGELGSVYYLDPKRGHLYMYEVQF